MLLRESLKLKTISVMIGAYSSRKTAATNSRSHSLRPYSSGPATSLCHHRRVALAPRSRPRSPGAASVIARFPSRSQFHPLHAPGQHRTQRQRAEGSVHQEERQRGAERPVVGCLELALDHVADHLRVGAAEKVGGEERAEAGNEHQDDAGG